MAWAPAARKDRTCRSGSASRPSGSTASPSAAPASEVPVVWFPRPVYEALPYAYAVIGAALVLAAFVVDSAPHGLLLTLGVIGLIAGLVVGMRRKEYRTSHAEYDPRSIED